MEEVAFQKSLSSSYPSACSFLSVLIIFLLSFSHNVLRFYEASGRFKVSPVLCSELCVFVCVCLK